MKDNHDLQLKCGVFLLFEKFKNNSLKGYGLCPSHYLSPPAISWDSMLNVTKVELELISNDDMYLFFEISMRDRASYISKRYSQANNRYLNLMVQKRINTYYLFGCK